MSETTQNYQNYQDLAKFLLLSQGLPNRRNEKWHYSDFSNIATNSQLIQDVIKPHNNWNIKQDSNNEYEFCENLAVYRDFIAEFTENKAEPLKEFLADDIVRQINFANFNGGLRLVVGNKNIEKEQFIELTNNISPNLSSGNYIVFNNHANVTVTEKHHASEPISSNNLSSCLSNLHLKSDACVNYFIIRDFSQEFIDLHQINVTLDANCNLNLYIVNINCSSRLRRQEINVKLKGEKSNFNFRVINLLQGAGHTDMTMVVHHLAPNTSSREILRNVVCDKSFGAFQGLIKVHNKAQKTDAKMNCNSLILSEDASFSAKPELEIFADDVACGHGATIAPINDTLLFYLISRGIDKSTARGLLIKAFISELLEENATLHDLLFDRINSWVHNFI